MITSLCAALTALFTGLVAPTAVLAQEYPTRPIRLLLGHSPGGGADQVARALSKPLSEQLGQPIVVENKPGANQIIAAELASRSAPDGYTLYLASQTSLVLNVGARKKLPTTR